jgi:parallel beta-helix repeat protein
MPMNQLMWGIIPLLALSAIAAEEPRLPAATYYVSPSGSDTNPGTSAAPWGSLQKAAEAMVPGDTALIADGEYDGGVIQARPGESGAPITFRALNPGGAIVRGDRSSEADAFAVTASHIVIDGLTVQQATRAGIALNGSSNVTVRRCRLLNNGRQGIFAVSGDDLLLEENECAFSVGSHGIFVSGGGDRPILRGNRVHDNQGSGIQVDADPEQLQPDLGTRGDGIITGALIERNVVYANGAGGGAAINLTSVRAARIVNNLLFNNLAGGIAGWDGGIGLEWGTRDNLILHNTIHFRPAEGRWCISLKNGSTGNVVQNNILSGGRRGALEIDNDSPIKSDYNLLARAGSQQIATNEDQDVFVPLEQWQSDTSNDAHSVVGEARFVKAGAAPEDFHLLDGSPAINSGADRTDVTVDLDGVIRPQKTYWDLGCYESSF